jgi:hypothetical protein
VCLNLFPIYPCSVREIPPYFLGEMSLNPAGYLAFQASEGKPRRSPFFPMFHSTEANGNFIRAICGEQGLLHRLVISGQRLLLGAIRGNATPVPFQAPQSVH